MVKELTTIPAMAHETPSRDPQAAERVAGDPPTERVSVDAATLRALLDAHEREAGRKATRYMVECRDASGGWYYVSTFPAWDRPESGAPKGYRRPCRITPLGPVGPAVTYEPEGE